MNQSLQISAPIAALALLSTTLSAHEGGTEGADWPQWRGPARDGLSQESDWTSEGKDELWSLETGIGYSSVAVVDGYLYTMGYDADAGLDLVWCLDAETGDEIWVHSYPAKIWNEFHIGGTLTTPSVGDGVVYTMNREGTFFALDAESGEVIFEKNYKQAVDAESPRWGFSGSPLILDDQVLVNVGRILSIDRTNGDIVWKSKDYGHGYSTPADFVLDGKELLAVFNGNGLAVIEQNGGKHLHQTEWKTQYDVNASTPIVVDDAIFISSGYNHGGALVAMTDEGLVPVWETRALKTHMSGCVLIDDHLYGFDESVLKCFGLDGEEKWSERGLGKGALMGTPNRLILMSGRGELIVAEASPEGYSELSKERVIDDGGEFWTKPVLAGGVIYCRSSKGVLVARDHRAER